MATTAKIGKRNAWTINVGAYNGGTKDHSKLFNRDANDQHPMGAIKGLETFAENTKAHMASKENPHEVTADQVGARPNTWMPTAAEVGARPDTWMPTAAEVGASPAGINAFEVSGNSIGLSNSGDAPLLGLKVYGKTTQNGTPTPKSPVPLESVGDSGSVAVTAAGKNLFGGKALANVLATFDYSQLDETAGTIQFVSSSASGKLIFQNFKENTRYTFILYGRNSNSDAKESNMTLRYTDGTSVPLRFSAAGSDSYCVLVSDGRKTIQSLHGEWHTATTTLYYNKCGVFEGELTEADFEPYKGKTLTMQTPNGLAAIPVWWAGNYTDENGQQWIRDEIDFVRGVRIQRVGRGTVGIGATVQLNGLVGGIFGVPNKMAGSNIGSLCDRAVFNASYTENTYYENPGNLVVMGSATDTQESLAEKFNGATILYALETPYETPLSAEELEQYAALHTHKPNTTIYNNGGANMDVRYCTPNTAVPIDLGRANSVLITDEHGCVVTVPIQQLAETIATLIDK